MISFVTIQATVYSTLKNSHILEISMAYKNVFIFCMFFIFSVGCTQSIFAMKKGNTLSAKERWDTLSAKERWDTLSAKEQEPLLKTFIFKACRYGYPTEDIEICIDQGGKLNIKNNKGVTPLHIACRYGQISIIKFLLANKADVNATMYCGFTPLHCTIITHDVTDTDKVTIIRHLLNAGANPDAKTKQGDTALNLVYQLNNKAIIELFPNQSSEDSSEDTTSMEYYECY